MPDPSPAEPRAVLSAALAAVIRDRLAIGAAAHLAGVGTLRRTHEPARVEVGPDGARVLHPPRHDVRFEPAPAPGAPPD